MLTRKFLKGMGLTDEQVDSIIDQHTETVDGLKEQIKEYRADAEKVPGLEKKLAEAQADLDTEKKSSWKVKYDALKEDFDAYKSEQTAKETHKAKVAAYRALLTEAGISEKRIAAVLKVSDVDSVELDSDGRVKSADKLKEGNSQSKVVETEYAEMSIAPFFLPCTRHPATGAFLMLGGSMENRRADHVGQNRTAYDKNRRRILETQNICALCGKPVDKSLKYPDPMAASVDHIIPINRGGHPSDINNLQLAHWICNRQKSDKMQREGDPVGAAEEKISNRNLPLTFDWKSYRSE